VFDELLERAVLGVSTQHSAVLITDGIVGSALPRPARRHLPPGRSTDRTFLAAPITRYDVFTLQNACWSLGSTRAPGGTFSAHRPSGAAQLQRDYAWS